jgi:hypothetical protein
MKDSSKIPKGSRFVETEVGFKLDYGAINVEALSNRLWKNCIEIDEERVGGHYPSPEEEYMRKIDREELHQVYEDVLCFSYRWMSKKQILCWIPYSDLYMHLPLEWDKGGISYEEISRIIGQDKDTGEPLLDRKSVQTHINRVQNKNRRLASGNPPKPPEQKEIYCYADYPTDRNKIATMIIAHLSKPFDPEERKKLKEDISQPHPLPSVLKRIDDIIKTHPPKPVKLLVEDGRECVIEYGNPSHPVNRLLRMERITRERDPLTMKLLRIS